MDDEFEGVELARRAQEMNVCQHKWQTEIKDGYTTDARKKKTEIKTCQKCGMQKQKEIYSAPISESTLWN